MCLEDGLKDCVLLLSFWWELVSSILSLTSEVLHTSYFTNWNHQIWTDFGDFEWGLMLQRTKIPSGCWSRSWLHIKSWVKGSPRFWLLQCMKPLSHLLICFSVDAFLSLAVSVVEIYLCAISYIHLLELQICLLLIN
jgi:hypothetical protein